MTLLIIFNTVIVLAVISQQVSAMIKKGSATNNRSLAISSVKMPKIALPKSQANSALSSAKNRNEYVSSMKQIGANNILNRRKQNILNSQFNKRISVLKGITKENKRIYQRINSQKSLYNQQDLRKSSVSVRSNSSKSSSRITNQKPCQKMRYRNSCRSVGAECMPVTIQATSLKTLKQENVSQFASMFMKIGNKQKDDAKMRKNCHSISMKIEKNNERLGMGDLLHNIMEEMYQQPHKKIRMLR